MTTYHRICIKDHTVTAKNGDSMSVERGKEYLTSEAENGEVCVFGQFWVWFPVSLFAGEKLFTGEGAELFQKCAS